MRRIAHERKQPRIFGFSCLHGESYLGRACGSSRWGTPTASVADAAAKPAAAGAARARLGGNAPLSLSNVDPDGRYRREGTKTQYTRLFRS